jgi:nucleoside-diphosphate-sugar epimerase
MHKIFNEWQAQDDRDKYGLSITRVRPANVTGPDKVPGSVDHVQCITQPARGKPMTLPYKDAMRLPIHVDDIAEVFVRLLLADAPRSPVYNSGGTMISLGELAEIVRGFLPEARISFEHETGGREHSGNSLVDNSRLLQEFAIAYPSSVKRCRILKDRIRLWKEGVRDLVMELCCALHNFRVRLTPVATNDLIGINSLVPLSY